MQKLELRNQRAGALRVSHCGMIQPPSRYHRCSTPLRASTAGSEPGLPLWVWAIRGHIHQSKKVEASGICHRAQLTHRSSGMGTPARDAAGASASRVAGDEHGLVGSARFAP